MAGIPKDLALDDAQLDELMTSSWNLRIATLGADGRINLTPLWFGWADGRVYAYCRGQKVVNLRRDPRVTVLVDRNERFPELQGVMFQGVARVLEDVAAEADDPHLDAVRAQMGVKYAGGHGEPAPAPGGEPPRFAASARGRHWRWVVVEPTHVVTWDNTKLPTR